MPLILEKSDRNELKFDYEGGSVVLYYSDPTTKQRIAYSNSVTRRKGRKIINDLAATRLAGGKAICTGIREGDLAVPADNEKGYSLISSDPQSPDYRKDWKELLVKHQADFLMLLGAHAFENTSVAGDMEFGDSGLELLDGDEEDGTDLGK